MLLQCTRDFNEQGITYKAGDVVTVPDVVGHWALSNYPAAFSPAPVIEAPPPDPVDALAPDVDGVETASLDAPPADKMIKHAPRRK